jgi:hypothetical protein
VRPAPSGRARGRRALPRFRLLRQAVRQCRQVTRAQRPECRGLAAYSMACFARRQVELPPRRRGLEELLTLAALHGPAVERGDAGVGERAEEASAPVDLAAVDAALEQGETRSSVQAPSPWVIQGMVHTPLVVVPVAERADCAAEAACAPEPQLLCSTHGSGQGCCTRPQRGLCR